MLTKRKGGSGDAASFQRLPFKGLYAVLSLVKALVMLLFLSLYYIPPRLRPHQTWTYKQSLLTVFTKLFFTLTSTFHVRTPHSLSPGANGPNFALIQPSSHEHYTGPIYPTASIQPTTIGAIWLPGPPSPTTTSTTTTTTATQPHPRHPRYHILHFHGGAYISLTPRHPTAKYGPTILSRNLQALCLLPQYHLASDPNDAFPAALQDAIASYAYLLGLPGVSPSKVLLSGDSAGGHIVVSMLHYLTSHGHETGLPLPAAALLHSPWLNMMASGTDVDNNPNAKGDYLSNELLEWGATEFVPKAESASGKYFSPLMHPFGLQGVPLWVQIGTSEVFFRDTKKWIEKMRGVEGNVLGVWEIDGGMHDVFAIGADFGMEEKAEEAVKEAGRWLEERRV